MAKAAEGRIRAGRVLIWIARITGTLLAVLVLLFLAAYALNPTGSESDPISFSTAASIAIFPLGVAVAFLLGWRWPLFGGLLAFACMAYFLVAIEGIFTPGSIDSGTLVPMVFYIPTMLYIMGGLLCRT